MSRISNRFRSILGVLGLTAAFSCAQAIPVVDTGPSPFLSNADPGISIFNDFFNGSQFVAGRFTTTRAYEITGLSGFFRGYACCGTIEYALNLGLATGSDNADGATFTDLFTGTTSFTSTNNSADWASIAVANYVLPAGTYWIVASSPLGFMAPGMPGGVPNPLDSYAFYSSELGTWRTLGDTIGGTIIPATFGFRVEGNPLSVPEPATLTLMLFGLGGLLLRLRRSTSA